MSASNIYEEELPYFYVQLHEIGQERKKLLKRLKEIEETETKLHKAIEKRKKLSVDHDLIKCHKCWKCGISGAKKKLIHESGVVVYIHRQMGNTGECDIE